jgi:hypothetical protein
MTTIEAFQRSIELEAAIARLKEARNPQELVTLWWEVGEGYEGYARKLMQAAYSKTLAALTGAGAA